MGSLGNRKRAKALAAAICAVLLGAALLQVPVCAKEGNVRKENKGEGQDIRLEEDRAEEADMWWTACGAPL